MMMLPFGTLDYKIYDCTNKYTFDHRNTKMHFEINTSQKNAPSILSFDDLNIVRYCTRTTIRT